MRLEGRTAVVTGGSRGIGKAIAMGLASEGADVAVQGDVSDRHSTRAMMDQNAGITSDKAFAKMDLASWREVLSINLDGAFNCTKCLLDHMVGRKYGRVVNITSVIGQIGNFGQANYAASKAGLMAFTKSLAKELATSGITVNAVAPGFIETEMAATIPEKVKTRLLGQIPMKRFGRADEVAVPLSTSPPTTPTTSRAPSCRSTAGCSSSGRTGIGTNEAFGLDGTFGFFTSLNVQTYLAKTRSSGRAGDDTSYRLQMDYNGDRYGATMERLAVGSNFNPEVGFLRRQDIRLNSALLRFSPRLKGNGAIRKL